MDRRVLVGILLAIFGGLSSLVLFSISRTEALGQFGFALMGLTVFGVVQTLPRRLLVRSAIFAFILTVGLLVFTFLRGYTAKGASRWFTIGPIRVQVSEIAKPVLALTLCVFTVRYPLRSQRRVFIYLVLSMVVVVLVLIEPDLGSALVLLAISSGILFVAIKKLTMLIPWILLFILGAIFSWNVILRPYQKERIYSFIGQSEQSGSSYNAKQSMITVGSGKILGRGIGHGVQTSLRFLPEHHTDFFFASFAEEAGFTGVIVLLILYLCLFLLLWWNISSLQYFDFLFRFALISGLFFQFGVHVLMNIGLAPVTGIPLPFLSSGGSSFVSLALFLGMGLRFSKSQKKVVKSSDVGFFHQKRDQGASSFAQIGF